MLFQNNFAQGGNMEKTGKPTAAGVLNIIAGVWCVLVALAMLFSIIAVGAMDFTELFEDAGISFIISDIQSVLVVQFIIAVIFAVLTILGGAFALKRKQWGWALAGSIIAIPGGFIILGVISTILVSVSKSEFE